MPLRAVIASLVLAVTGVAANAETIAYGEAFDTLYAFELSTRNAVPVGRAGTYGGTALANVEGLTFSPDGQQLYAVSDTLLKVLMTIDRNTGAASVIGPLGGSAGLGDTGQGNFNVLDLGMSFTCDGKLWLSSGATGSLWEIDPATASSTKVGNLGVTITGLTARGNELIGTGSHDDPNLYLIDPKTAKATAIGGYGAGVSADHHREPGIRAFRPAVVSARQRAASAAAEHAAAVELTGDDQQSRQSHCSRRHHDAERTEVPDQCHPIALRGPQGHGNRVALLHHGCRHVTGPGSCRSWVRRSSRSCSPWLREPLCVCAVEGFNFR